MDDDLSRPFSSAVALRYGWNTTKANVRPLLILSAVGAFIALIHQSVTRGGDGQGFSHPALGLGLQVLQACVTMAFIRVSLKLHDGQPVDLTRPREILDGFFPYLATSLLYGLIVFGGLLLLIVPGVYWGIKFGYAGFLVVDKKLEPMEAFRQSSRLTRGVKKRLFSFGLGLFFTIPTTFVASAYVFRHLQARQARMEAAGIASQPPMAMPHTPATSH